MVSRSGEKKRKNKTKIPGFTKERRDAFLAKYPFCMICLSSENLRVDHCHSTRKVRAVLCNHCNSGLGFFRDDTRLLENAIKYLDYFWRLHNQ